MTHPQSAFARHSLRAKGAAVFTEDASGARLFKGAFMIQAPFRSGRVFAKTDSRIGPRVASRSLAGSRGPLQFRSDRVLTRADRCSPLADALGEAVLRVYGGCASTASGLFHSVEKASRCQADAHPSVCAFAHSSDRVRRAHACKLHSEACGGDTQIR